MDNGQFSKIVSFLWSIPNEILRDVYVRGKYRDVVLPMVVLRRLDAVLESTKEKVLATKKKLDEQGFTNQEEFLCEAAGQAFYNCSPFLLKDLTSRATVAKLKADFLTYLDGFSSNVQEVLDKFKFRNQIDTLVEADILGALIEKFLDKSVNLSIEDVKNENGEILLPKLDNHAMGTIFEELIRLFNEENNEEAGEHFTPRDIVDLMASLTFEPIRNDLKDGTYLIYDGACGTGGMLTLAQEKLQSIAEEKGKKLSIDIYGQEVQPETYAISKADILVQGEGASTNNIVYGSTLSADGLNRMKFDFMISNPPYGKNWNTCKEKMSDSKGKILDSRFILNYANDPEYSFIPKVSDGQLLFLMNNVSKMVNNTELGSRIVEVHNGSSLFTGDAGQGESNARRYMFEQDMVEAIIALPLNMFYNTGIATYIWVLTNRKLAHKKGKTQLIDATAMFEPLKKNLGDKNCKLTDEHISQIVQAMIDFEESEISKIFKNEEFGYYKIVVESPLKDEAGNIVKKGNKPFADKALKDTENVPLLYEGGIEEYFKREVLPYNTEAWIDKTKTKIGYELSFTKYFYKPTVLRTLDEIEKEIAQIENEAKGLLQGIFS